MNISGSNSSVAKAIWENRKLYIGYAIRELKNSEAEAKDLLEDIVESLLKNNTYNPRRSPLNYFVKLRMRSRNKDIQQKRINDENAQIRNLESQFSVTSDDYLDDLPSSKKDIIINLVNNPIKTYRNFKNKILVTTKDPHKALVGYVVKFKNLTDIDILTNKRLSNQFGDEIYISEILDENNLIIEVNFDHSITPINCGGNDAKIGIMKVNNTFQKNSFKEKIYGHNEDEKKLHDIEVKRAQEKCLNRFKTEERFIFLTNLKKIKQRNLGEKLTEPKFDNEGKPLKIGDVYMEPLPESQATRDKQYSFKCYNGTQWQSIDNNPIFNKPIGTKRITYLFNKKFSKNLSESRIGEIIAHVKKSFATCMNQKMGYANG